MSENAEQIFDTLYFKNPVLEQLALDVSGHKTIEVSYEQWTFLREMRRVAAENIAKISG